MTSIPHTLRAAALAAAALFIGLGAQAQTTVSENFNGLTGKTSSTAPNTTPYGAPNSLTGSSNSLISWTWSDVGNVSVGGNDYNNAGNPIIGDNFIIIGRNASFSFNFSLLAPVSNLVIGFNMSNVDGTAGAGVASNSYSLTGLGNASGPLPSLAGPGNPGPANGSESFLKSFDGLAAGSYAFTWARSGPPLSGSLRIDDFSATVTAVPEPETYAMMLAGLGAIGFMSRRRKARQA